LSIQALLRKVTAADVYRALGVGEDGIEETPDAYKTHCLFHPESISYSLISEKVTSSTYCLDLGCRLSRLNDGGGNLFEFYALAKSISYDEALEEWAERAKGTLELKGEDEAGGERDISYFQNVEVARFVHAQGEDEEIILKPAHLAVDGLEVTGRGIVVSVSRLPSLLAQYPTDLYRSMFLYELSDKQAIDAEYRRGQLYMLGNYFAVFEARTSAEIVHAINQAIDLVERLNRDYDIPFEAMSVYYSHKLIEVEVDYTVFGVTPRRDLDRVYGEITRMLVELSENGEGVGEYTQLKREAYSYDFITSVPGSGISLKGREIYKIRLAYNLFKKTSYQRLHELSQRRPELSEKPPVEKASKQARLLFERAVRGIEGEGKIEEHEKIASLYSRGEESVDLLTTADELAKTLFKRLFSENRLILRTPSAHLNRILGGGLYPGNLYLIAGFPGSGTTTFSLWLMMHIAQEHNIPCVFVSLQTGIEELFQRALASIGHIDLSEISEKRLRPSELYSDTDFHRRTFSAFEEFQELMGNVTILEGTRIADMDHMRKLVADLKRRTLERNGTSNVFVVIDSLQLLLAQIKARAETGNSYDQETLTSRLKAMARELDVTMFVTVEYYAEHHSFSSRLEVGNQELKRLYESTQFADAVAILSPQGCHLSDLADYYQSAFSGTPQEEVAHRVIERLKQAEENLPQREDCRELSSVFTVLDVIKNRSGMTAKVVFIFHRAIADFEPVEYSEPADGV